MSEVQQTSSNSIGLSSISLNGPTLMGISSDSRFASSPQFSQLPPETQTIIKCSSNEDNETYLTTLSQLALQPSLTELILTCYQPVFADLVSRWPAIASAESMAAAFARILPVQPHLLVYAESFLFPPNPSFLHQIFPTESKPHELECLPTEQLIEILLSLYRLLSFRKTVFLGLVNLEIILPLLKHASRVVRYLAVKSISLCLSAAEHAEQHMLSRYVGQEAIVGTYEGCTIDYGFLPLLETKRLANLADDVETVNECNPSFLIRFDNCLSPGVANLCGVLVPRLKGLPRRASEIVLTPSTQQSIRAIALALLSPKPILITGIAGSGKTFLIHEVAESLAEAESLVSIHLGDQTDAKLLIGAYTTGNTPGSFIWRPGVLTTAVREGRWVLFEDIDKAPTDVLSILLPLMEGGELYIPSRGERVTAGRGFRLIGTLRTTGSSKTGTASVTLLGGRLWNRIDLPGLSDEELHLIARYKFPRLNALTSILMNVFKQTSLAYKEPTFFAKSKVSLGRQISSRDLFKWCTRIDALFEQFGYKERSETIPDQIYDEIFKEAVDCFAGSLQTGAAKEIIVEKVAEEMHIPRIRVQLYLGSHAPVLRDFDKSVTIGRAKLLKKKKGMRKVESTAFAITKFTLRLMEQIGVAVRLAEPVLLVGETGTGKTTAVQHSANLLGHNLLVLNLSQQTESGDLLGGYKPIDMRTLAVPLKDTFEDLFEKTFSLKRNTQFLEMLNKCFSKQQWNRVVTLWKEAIKRANAFFEKLPPTADGQPKKKKRKVDEMKRAAIQEQWVQFTHELTNLERQSSQLSKSFAFSFVEGCLVKAARNGDWVLLDEINLASADTLESISDLLKEGGRGSILLTEKGSVERIVAHPDFRIFGCMNPATDVGKRDLPSGFRSRFTEIFVESPDNDLENLIAIVSQYIGHLCLADERAPVDVARLYLDIKKLTEEHRLVDGGDQKPHFSLRTLARTLMYVNDISPIYGLRRSLYEGFCMTFLTVLDQSSERILLVLLDKYLLVGVKNVRSLINQIPKRPDSLGVEFVQIRHYWMPRGQNAVEEQPDYIITPFVEKNLLNLVRATTTRRFPILIQGPTSSGKTSMIEYLAKRTGHHFVRINNHEHTDLEEYLGTYVSDSEGRLVFQEGILVEALRRGYWLVLDELNLAPTDVLEALNRLLDDNRELFIPETQEVIKPHENFILFATQNPPGLYGGRKILSRAFRNRFLELHFLDIPADELEIILRERCKIAPSYCTKIVGVYKELSVLRQTTRLFESKNSFATLRDLFRWAHRQAIGYQRLAENGFMLLAERVRREEEKVAVKQVIEKIMKVSVDVENMYAESTIPEFSMYSAHHNSANIVWTKAMRRLFALVAEALRNNEPVLLVGETGCGKTTVCQMLAHAFNKELHIVNAHQNTETSDIIGAQRPVRNRSAHHTRLLEDLTLVFTKYVPEKWVIERRDVTLEELIQEYSSLEEYVLQTEISRDLLYRIEENRRRVKALFEWRDGSLITAMKQGDFFLLDEISLADDSVLERLNSVLESGRTIFLAEKGPEKSKITPSDGFQFFATMNPGGDYGKKELSPALRNRFTEIWVPAMTDLEDVLQIVSFKLNPNIKRLGSPIVRFSSWYSETYQPSSTKSISIRDVLSWVSFANAAQAKGMSPAFCLLQGAAMVFIDSMGANPSALVSFASEDLHQEKERCVQYLSMLAGQDLFELWNESVNVTIDARYLKFGAFELPRKQQADHAISFNLEAPTTSMNAMRVARAMQLRKPILLEGSPGVGKTSLISALAEASGNPLTRINLSEQTDLIDLFGSDVPVEGAECGEFEWRNAPFLQAMQLGHWLLLDEMNLASQSVLEGLNSCLDHRGEAYIAELDRTFVCHPDFMVFAAQNPHYQGGGRKGLPASFVNRFTVVYMEALSMQDLEMISKRLFPTIAELDIKNAINFVVELDREVTIERLFGTLGAPWEFNLRDTLRWLQLMSSSSGFVTHRPVSDFVDIIFKSRFRNHDDRSRVDRLCAKVFNHSPKPRLLYHQMTPDWFQVGYALLPRRQTAQPITAHNKAILTQQLGVIEIIMICVQQNWPCILVGPSGCGKSSVIELIANIVGAKLDVLPLNADMDTVDIVGGYEQVDITRHMAKLIEDLKFCVQELAATWLQEDNRFLNQLLRLLTSMTCQSEPGRLRDLALQIRDVASNIEGSTALFDHVELLIKELKKPSNARFEWVDGMLVRAIQEGHWLVLDNANLCSSSVLDRLNSLLEPGGKLIINEHNDHNGQPRSVEPHPGFRLFITMDPKYGELSRAMRNRGIEIFMDPNPVAHPVAVEEDQKRILVSKLGVAAVGNSAVLAQCLIDPRNALLSASVLDVSLKFFPMDQFKMLFRWRAFLEQVVKEGKISDHITCGLDVLDHYTKLFSDRHLNDIMNDFLRFSFQAMNLAESNLKSSQVSDRAIPVTASIVLIAYVNKQPFHPLVNSSLVQERTRYPAHLDPFNLATYYDVVLAIIKMKCTKQNISHRAATTKLERLTFLEKSAARTNGRKSSTETVVEVFEFLSGVLAALADWGTTPPIIDSVCEPSNSNYHSTLLTLEKQWLNCIKELIRLWQDLVRISNSLKLDTSIFQVYISLFNEWINSSKSVLSPRLIEAVLLHLTAFDTQLRRSTGFSMEIIWNHMHPAVPQTLYNWDAHLQLMVLVSRFDTVVPHFSSSLAEIKHLRKALAGTLSLSVVSQTQPEELVKELSDHIMELERRVASGRSRKRQLFFTSQFDYILKSRDLDFAVNVKKVEIDDDIVTMCHFADRPTSALLRYQAVSQPLMGYEAILGDFWTFRHGDGSNAGILTLISGNFLRDILATEQVIRQCSIEQLPTLQCELHVLGKQLVLSNVELSQNPLLSLSKLLLKKIQKILDIHHDRSQRLHDFFARLELAFDANSINTTFKVEDVSFNLPSGQFLEVVRQHFMPAISALTHIPGSPHERVMKLCGEAWIHYSIGCLKLYVPNCSFDPAMKPIVQRERYLARKKELEDNLAIHKTFFLRHSGQIYSPIIEEIKRELEELGDLPPSSTIARPMESQMEPLQSEMSMILCTFVLGDTHEGLLRSILHREPGYKEVEELFQENLSQIINRLQNYPLYKDLIDPLIGFLYSLKLGLSIASTELRHDTTIPIELLEPREILAPKLYKPTDLRSLTNGVILQLLWHVAGQAQIEEVENLGESTRKLVHHGLETLFQEWKVHQLKEKEKLQTEASLYRYRGAEEDDDESKIREIFPDYEDDMFGMLEAKGEKQTQRERAWEIANCHISMLSPQFCEKISLRSLLSRALTLCSVQAGLVSSKDPNAPAYLGEIFPAHIYALRSLEDWLASHKTVTTTYDFYKDHNVEQAQQLVAITQRIQRRVTNLIEAWPENVTLQDAYDTCQQLVSLPITTPVAKLLVMIEKLHGILNEWQSVASKEYSAAGEYEAVTQLIISWRRLELQSWPRLFDIEDGKCQEEAYSWWFFLYESIIHNPMQLLLSEQPIDEHILQLLATLNAFMKNSTLGQFKFRLQLVEVFEQHLMKLMDTDQLLQLTILGNAIRNLTSYFSEYVASVAERLAAERKRAEKDINEVVLLASWKDTNILALRESARRSHYNLYKIIHRYRQVQNSPVLPLLQNGMPDITSELSEPLTPPQLEQNVLTFSPHIEVAQSICSQAIKDWKIKPRRLLDPSFALEQMVRFANLPLSLPDVAQEIESYAVQIISTIKDFQSQTPAFLTDKNKDAVKHLKSRKRKAFTDALKALREMGLKANLSGSQLARLESVEVIFAETAPIDSNLGFSATKYYLRILEAFPKVRAICQEHSADLTGTEVHRGVGHIEHLIYLASQQRNELWKCSRDYNEMAQLVSKYELLASPLEEPEAQLYDYGTANKEQFSRIRRMYLRLPHLIDLALEGLEAYTSFSGMPMQQDKDFLSEWKRKALEIGEGFKSISLLADNILDAKTKHFIDVAFSARDALERGIIDIQAHHPNIAYITRQILPWLSTVTSSHHDDGVVENGDMRLSLINLDEALKTSANSIFVAIQKLKKGHDEYPTNTEEQGWFVNYQNACINSINSMHIPSITVQLAKNLERLTQLGRFSQENSVIIRAVFTFYFPIIQKFQAICSETIIRLARFHHATTKMTYVLSTSALTLGTKGFCTPAGKSEEKGNSGELESGTGLGDGDGAEDISNDMAADEDPGELIQENQKEEDKNREIEDEKDAIDIEDEMEGLLGDITEGVEGEGRNDKEDEENEMDEETGEVDELDPTAVDEKLWGEKGDEDDREKEGGAVKGKKVNKDEMEAKKNNGQNERGEAEDADDANEEREEQVEGAADDSDEVRPEEREIADQHIPEVDTLDLPDDMELDKNGREEKEDDDLAMDDITDLSEDDLDNYPPQDHQAEVEQFPEANNQEGVTNEKTIDINETGQDGEDGQTDMDQDIQADGDEAREPGQPESIDSLKHGTDESKFSEEISPSEAQGIQASGEENQDTDPSSSARQDSGVENSANEPRSLGNERIESTESQHGQRSVRDINNEEFDQQETVEEEQPPEKPTLKKLGDALQRWHRQQNEILDAQQKMEEQKKLVDDEDFQNAEFEHLPDDHAEADTQALGIANQDQAHSVDDTMAVDTEIEKKPPAGFEEDSHLPQDTPPENPAELSEDQETSQSEDLPKRQLGASVGIRNQLNSNENIYLPEIMDVDIEQPYESMISLISNGASNTDSFLNLRSTSEARTLWKHYEHTTQDLSRGLCEQLRLILEPTLSTKMRGDFRTGKRLNLKRIIPYIASQYKKDKIWMRRTKPSKRQYQVMLALDDSKSMAESPSTISLAFETITLISKALSMLEVGQISIVSFGETAKVVHPFEQPFTSDAGVNVLRHFTFAQLKTNVKELLNCSIALFDHSRAMTASSPSSSIADLWQLQIIISDGVCEDHASTLRLIREAQQKKIMIVFVIIDALRESSIMEMNQVNFSKDGELKMERYLSTFPFGYYLVVKDVKDLPVVLAGALRQWLAEIVEASF